VCAQFGIAGATPRDRGGAPSLVSAEGRPEIAGQVGSASSLAVVLTVLIFAVTALIGRLSKEPA